ncbi:MAG: hypothetical protein WB988_18135 [Candidatus Nitrosopolaris sp.]|jgi:putative ABC transport system permease protein
MIVFARYGSDVSVVVQEITRLYGSDNLGIVTPAAIMQAQHHTQSGSSSFTLEIGFIAMLVSAIGVVTTLWTSVNERTKQIGTMKCKTLVYFYFRCFRRRRIYCPDLSSR